MSNSTRVRWRSVIGAAAVSIALAAPITSLAQAQDFPEKPVRLIVPFPAGGALDLTSRAFVSVAEQYLGQPMIVVIRAGGGGAVGADAAAKAEPDGYTLFLGEPGSTIILPIAQATSYSSDDFIPLGQIVSLPAVVSVLSDSPYGSMDDLINAAKENPGKIRHSAVNMSPELVMYERLESMTGADFTHVPQTGGGPAMAALLSGDVETYAPFPPVVFPHIQSGTVRPLAVASPVRWSTLPDVPTLMELGYDIDEAALWIAVFAPKGTPQPVVEKLREVVKQITEDKSFGTLMERMGQPPQYMSGEEFEAKYAEQREVIKGIIEGLAK
jgi:tripartite-type tricarboxylate transporter receptor subunit TctC